MNSIVGVGLGIGDGVAVRRARAILVIVSALAAGCLDQGPPDTVIVEVSPRQVTLTSLGEVEQLVAGVTVGTGATTLKPRVPWSSSAPNIASVNDSGLVTAVANGEATVTAMVAGASDSARVTVAQAVRTVAVSPPEATFRSIGETRQLEAVAWDNLGYVVDGVKFTWQSIQPGTVSVDSSGRVTSIEIGSARVFAAAGDAADTTLIFVYQRPFRLAFGQQPSTRPARVPFMPPVSIRVLDSVGSPIRDLATLVSLSVESNSYGVGPELGGLNGDSLIVFRNLSIYRAGQSFRMIATSESLIPDTSARFNIVLNAGSLSAGDDHSCLATTEYHLLYCWGAGGAGRLGNGGTASNVVPDSVSGANTIAGRVVSAGTGHTCALGLTYSWAYCWGSNTHGQLGDGTNTDSDVPVPVMGPVFRSVSAGGHSCGISNDSVGYCWGDNAHGQLGNGTTISSNQPAMVSIGLALSTISAGTGHSCGLTVEGQGYCWGRNDHGQMGDGTSVSTSVPSRVSGNLTFKTISAGAAYSCAVAATGGAFCWGDNSAGQLGTGSKESANTPVAVSGALAWAQISAGYRHTCALTEAGTAYCWGENAIGSASVFSSTVPIPVGRDLTFTSIDVGSFHSCATASDGAVWCWGHNPDGQLGLGATPGSGSAIPAMVAPPAK